MACRGLGGLALNVRVGLLWALLGLTACSPTVRSVLPDKPLMPSSAAREILKEVLARGCSDGAWCSTVDIRVGSAAANLTIAAPGSGAAFHSRIPFTAPLGDFRCGMWDQYDCHVWAPARVRGLPESLKDHPVSRHFPLMARDEAEARKVLDAFNSLVLYARSDVDGQAFAVAAARWRAAVRKPSLSESAEKHRVLAENAFREKDTYAAIEHYEAALETDPTWPNGNFNLALLLAETGDYALAARHMKRYLLLVPESKDAKVANDKIIVWEEKARAL